MNPLHKFYITILIITAVGASANMVEHILPHPRPIEQTDGYAEIPGFWDHPYSNRPKGKADQRRQAECTYGS